MSFLYDFQWIESEILKLVWPFLRILAFIISAPVFGSKLASIPFKITIAMALTIVIYPNIHGIPSIDPISLDGLVTISQQIIIGIMFGLIVHVMIETLVMSAQILSMQIGLGFATLVDPQSGVTVPLIGQLYLIMTVLIYLASNGHLFTLKIFMETFNYIPISTHGLEFASFWDFVLWSKIIFSSGLLIALPGVTSLLIVNLAFGVMSKASPQLNIFAIGFPFTLVLGLGILCVSIIVILPQTETLLAEVYDFMESLIMKNANISR